ncbi:MAG: chromate efflux transporter [Alphaproteobacteria bacterium]
MMIRNHKGGSIISNLEKPSLSEATKAYFKIGVLSFGGPAAQIALMHKVFVDEKAWLSEKQYMNALSFCMLLPGPEAMQLATYAGWRLHGIIGGLVAGLLFVLPGALVILLLALLYANFGNMGWMQAAFIGIKAAVVIIVIEALLRVSKKALLQKTHWIVAAAAFLGIFIFEVPYPLIVALAGIFGFIYAEKNAISTEPTLPLVSLRQTLTTISIGLTLWLAPLMIIGFATGWGFLYHLGLFFAKLATVTFGGAYAVLAYMSQQVVFELNWLTTAQMMDGLGLAETTPGPLILVTEFVGFMAGFQVGGIMLAVVAAILVLWVTFVPCFLWIFAGAPYIEWITARPRLQGALSQITAAVVGVILSLSIWFALHVFFDEIHKVAFGPAHIWQPIFDSVNMLVLLLSCLSYYLLIRRHMNIVLVLGICAAASVVISQFA